MRIAEAPGRRSRKWRLRCGVEMVGWMVRLEWSCESLMPPLSRASDSGRGRGGGRGTWKSTKWAGRSRDSYFPCECMKGPVLDSDRGCDRFMTSR